MHVCIYTHILFIYLFIYLSIYSNISGAFKAWQWPGLLRSLACALGGGEGPGSYRSSPRVLRIPSGGLENSQAVATARQNEAFSVFTICSRTNKGNMKEIRFCFFLCLFVFSTCPIPISTGCGWVIIANCCHRTKLTGDGSLTCNLILKSAPTVLQLLTPFCSCATQIQTSG